MTETLRAVHTLIDLLALDLEEYGDVARMLRRIERAAQQLFAPDVCTITAINPETGQFLLPLDARSAEHDPAGRPSRPVEDGLTRYVLEHGALFVDDLALEPSYANSVTAAHGIRSFAAVALHTRPYATGLAVLYLNYRRPRTYSDQMRQLLEVFVDQASAALQQAWLFFRYAEVARIGQEINQQLDSVETIFKRLAANIGDILDTSYAFMLAVYQPATETLDFHVIDNGQYRQLAGQQFAGGSRWVITEQRPLLIRRLSAEEPALPVQLRDLPESDTREESLMFVPLIVGRICLGLLSIQHPLPAFFDEEDLQVLRLLGNHTALALYNLRLVNDLRQLNAAGQCLTQQLDSEQVLQSVVEQIRSTTQADLAVLYPYVATTRHFDLPPRLSGKLRVPDYPRVDPPRPDDIALLTLHHTAPVYVEDSTTLYAALGGDSRLRQGSFTQREGVLSTAAMPLCVSDEPVGALFINFRRQQRFDAPQRQLIEGLANYAAIAIANARAFDALVKRRVRELEALRMIDHAISQTLDLAQVMGIILEGIKGHIAVEDAAIILFNLRTQMLECQAAIGRSAVERKGLTTPLDARALTHWVFQHRQPVRVGDVRTEAPWNELYLQIDDAVQSELDVPLTDDGEVLGVINLESTRRDAFSQADEDFVITLAGQAVLAIKNAQAYEREKRLADERQAIIDISREITSQLDPARVFDLILTRALEVTRSKVGTLHLYDPEHRNLYLVADRGVVATQKSRRIALDEGIVGMVAHEGILLNVLDVQEPRWQKVHIPDIPSSRSELAVPLLEGAALRGVLNIEHPDPAYFGPRDERLMLALSDLAVIAIQNAERYQRAEAGRLRLDALHRVDQQIIRQLDTPEQVIKTVLEAALALTGGDVAHLDLYADGAVSMIYFGWRDLQTGSLPVVPIPAGNSHAPTIPRGIVRHVAETLRPYRTGDAQRDPIYAGDADIHSAIAVPLLAEAELFGVLNLESRRADAFDEDDERMLVLLASQAIIAIQSARQYEVAAQAQQRALAAETMSSIGHAAFELAHRLGNDLGPIIPATNAIRNELQQLGVASPSIARNLDHIVSDKTKVTDLIKALKEELGDLREQMLHPPEKIDILVQDLLYETVHSCPLLPANVEVQIELAENIAPVRGVYKQVADILRNLFDNAVQALPEGGTIILRARNVEHDVAIQVIDNGSGIPDERQARIFDLFYSTRGGFGFGLWSARRNALANSGELTVESQPGAGTTFTLSLPRARKPIAGVRDQGPGLRNDSA